MSTTTQLRQTLAQGPEKTTQPLDPNRLRRAKRGHTTRRVPLGQMTNLVTGGMRPRSGDLVLARVARLGQHQRLESPQGRRSDLYPGDEIIVCYGDRYAPDQFEAYVPERLETCNLVAAGGLAAHEMSRRDGIRAATVIEPLGLIAEPGGNVLNLDAYACPQAQPITDDPLTLAVVGTSMNAGKTTTVAYAIRGMAQSGLKVGAAKLTGSGAGRDRWSMIDAGAEVVLDFIDIGLASTFRASPEVLEHTAREMIDLLRAEGCEAIVLEVADGLYQPETDHLLCSPTFRDRVHGLLFAAGDAMGAAAGVNWLRQHCCEPLAVTGVLTRSPLGRQEAERVTGATIIPTEQLAQTPLAEWLAAGGVALTAEAEVG